MITIEKVMFLHEVPLFRYVSNEVLLELAFVIDEKFIASGEAILKKGEFGSDMYIIVQGRVKVHDEEKVLAELGSRDVFGELAALSPELRTASATALENVVLLKINHEMLYDTMARHIGLVKGVIEVLCQRTRDMAKHM